MHRRQTVFISFDIFLLFFGGVRVGGSGDGGRGGGGLSSAKVIVA